MFIPEEPVPSNVSFRKESNILFTSHVAGALHFSYKNIREMMMDDIRQILERYATNTITKS